MGSSPTPGTNTLLPNVTLLLLVNYKYLSNDPVQLYNRFSLICGDNLTISLIHDHITGICLTAEFP